MLIPLAILIHMLIPFATTLLTTSPTPSTAPALLLYETYQLRARLHSLKPGSLEDYDEAKELDSDPKEIFSKLSTPHNYANNERWNFFQIAMIFQNIQTESKSVCWVTGIGAQRSGGCC